MKTYCLKCKKDTENIDPKIFNAKGLLSNLGINTAFSQIPLLNILF